jgi:hypothetical protein
MLHPHENRVLSRIHARDLTEKELMAVSGTGTEFCTFDPKTNSFDGCG